MRTFLLWRNVDVSGVSGTGLIAEGVQFSDGVCVCRWMTDMATTCVYASISDVKAIHGHDGATQIIWEDMLTANNPISAPPAPTTASSATAY